MLDWLRKVLLGPGPNLYYPNGLRPPPFLNCGVRTQKEIWDAIEEQVGLGGIGPFGDMLFQVTTAEALEVYAKWWAREHAWMRGDISYQTGWRDCDNFSAAFIGDLSKWPGWLAMPKAVVWSNLYGGHAYNYVVALENMDRLGVYLVNPQSGEVEKMEADHFEKYGPAQIMIS